MREEYSKLKRNLSNGMSRIAQALGKPRVVILHNHLFKNAGSTIDWALQNYFGEDFVDHRDDDQMRRGKVYLGPYLQAHRDIKALSSHHLTMPLPEEKGLRLLTIIMIRHPIERATSVYNFERVQQSDTHPGVIHARKLALRDYILWRMKPEVGSTLRNFQVRKMLPPRKAGQETFTEAELAGIRRQVSGIEMLGLVERFDESMVLFEECLKKIYPNIDLSYVAQNVGQKETEKTEERLARLKAEIGDEAYELLLTSNQQDMELLRLVQEEIAARMAATKDFAKKLAAFRTRCAAKLAATAQ